MTIRMPEPSDTVFAYRHSKDTLSDLYTCNELCQSGFLQGTGYLNGDVSHEVKWEHDGRIYNFHETEQERDMRRLRDAALGHWPAVVKYVDGRPLTDDHLLITIRPGEIKLLRVPARAEFKSLSLFSLANYQLSILRNAEGLEPSKDYMTFFGADFSALAKANRDQVVNAHQTWLQVGDYLPVRLEGTNQSACLRLQTKLDNGMFDVEAFFVGEPPGNGVADIASTVLARVGGAEVLINTPLGTIWI